MCSHELAQFCLHFGPDFAAHPHIEHQPRILRCKSAEFGGRQFLFAQKSFDEAVDVHNVSSSCDPVLLARIG